MALFDFMTDASNAIRHGELAAELTSEIASGRYSVGMKFPTERELQDRYGVGRHTVREALKVMTEQGLIGRRRKAGTVVLAQRPVSSYVHSLRDIHSLFSFAQDTRLDIRQQGFISVRRSNDRDLALQEGRYLRIAGVRYKVSDGRPLCWSEIYVPERYAPDRKTVNDGVTAIYDLILKQYGLRLESVNQDVAAMVLPRTIARELDAEDQVSALSVLRHYYTAMSQLFEMSRNIYPADRFSVRTSIRQRA